MSKATIEQLRAEIDALPMSGRGRRYPAELRAPIAEMARASEQSYGRVAAALGKLEVTLTCWCQAPRDTRMHRVVITEPERRAELTFTTRDGHRVIGLDVAGVAELL